MVDVNGKLTATPDSFDGNDGHDLHANLSTYLTPFPAGALSGKLLISEC